MLLLIRQGTKYCLHLLQLVLALDSLHPFLLHISVGGLPHVVVLNNVLHCFPWQEIRPDVVESPPVLLHGLLKEASSRRPPLGGQLKEEEEKPKDKKLHRHKSRRSNMQNGTLGQPYLALN